MTNQKPTTYILYLDTSELTTNIAIFDVHQISRPRNIVQLEWEAGRELSNTLSGKYEEALKKSGITAADLAGICVFVGPGSFTGLRICLSFANGLAFALGIPVYETTEKGVLNLSEPKDTALPFYGAEPKITKPKAK
jgi:tRNA threonylcarbamoyladenosine biosynthesis protein TsaB